MGHIGPDALKDYLDKHPEAAERLGPAAVAGVAQRAAERASQDGSKTTENPAASKSQNQNS